MLIKSFSTTRQHLLFLPNLCVRRASAAVATTEVSRESSGIPLDEGPSSSLPSGGERHIPQQVRELVEKIAALSLLEVADLNYALKKRLNIPDVPMTPQGGMFMSMAAAASQAATAREQQHEEETAAPTKTSYSLKLNKFDETNKIALIKEVRACLPGMNLVNAKKLIEKAPIEIKGDLGLKEAEELKLKLEQAGASCEVL